MISKTRPVDPRDLFRGDYVILNYEISNVNLEDVPSDIGNPYKGQSVFVRGGAI